MVILELPFCFPRAVSPKHEARFGPALKAVRTLSGLKRALLQQSIVDCYCENPLDAILALAKEDCVFETMVERSDPAGFDFYQCHQNGRRRYQTGRPLGRLLRLADLDTGNRRLLESRILPLAGLELTVETIETRHNRPTRLRAWIGPEDSPILPPLQFRVAVEPKYLQAHNAFVFALGALDAGRTVETVNQLLDEQVEASKADSAAYAGFRSLVSGVFRLDMNRCPGTETVRSRIRAILDRLWDAPAVGRPLRRELAALFADTRRVNALLSKLPGPVRMGLLEAQLPQDELDALDAVSGAVKLGSRDLSMTLPPPGIA